MAYDYPLVSADSHITEPPGTYVDHIDPAWRARAPRIVNDPDLGDLFVVEGMAPIKLGLVAAAGKRPEEIRPGGLFEEMHRSGWDPSGRIADQERDGISAEVLYPTVGMMLCNHADFEFKHACFVAYNRWITGYCAGAPDRLLGIGQTAAATPEQAVDDLHAIVGAGLRGVMMPGTPGTSDYDQPEWDVFWAAAAAIGVPVSYHILTTAHQKIRGNKLNAFLHVIRGVQDILGLLTFGGVFQRHPNLRIVCVEADAGWVPHFMYRMDHAYKRHRHHLAPGHQLERLPSEYFSENVYFTFQDDWTAFSHAEDMNWHRLMWANDFPHSDSTWPRSQELLAAQTPRLAPDQTRAILSTNCADLYGIDLAKLPVLS